MTATWHETPLMRGAETPSWIARRGVVLRANHAARTATVLWQPEGGDSLSCMSHLSLGEASTAAKTGALHRDGTQPTPLQGIEETVSVYSIKVSLARQVHQSDASLAFRTSR
jgi:hypothetical protein